MYGELNDSLVFARRKDLNRLCACRYAISNAKTWGEFRKLAGHRTYKELIHLILWDSHRKLNFAMFHKELLKTRPDIDLDCARKEFLEMPIGERLPEDGDTFNSGDTPIDDGDWPGPANQESETWIPHNIQKNFGSRDYQGYLTFDCDERRLLAAFKQAGFRCVRDDDLINRASGYAAEGIA